MSQRPPERHRSSSRHKDVPHINLTSGIRKDIYVKKPEYLVRCTEIDSQRGICDRMSRVDGSFSGRPAEKTFSRTAEETPSHAWSSSTYAKKLLFLRTAAFS